MKIIVFMAQAGEVKQVVDLVDHTGTLGVLTMICIALGAYTFWLQKSFVKERKYYNDRMSDTMFLVSDIIKRLGQLVKSQDNEYLNQRFEDMVKNWKKNNSQDED